MDWALAGRGECSHLGRDVEILKNEAGSIREGGSAGDTLNSSRERNNVG